MSPMIIAAYLSIALAAVAAVPDPDGMAPLPRREAAIELAGRAYDAAPAGGHVLAATSGGLAVYDVREPSAPRLVATMLFPGSGNAVAVEGSRAFLSLGPDGLRIIDVSVPSRPRYIAGLDTDGSVNAARPVGTDLLVVADGVMGLKLIDIADIDRPRVIDALDTGGYARHLAVAGGLVAVAQEAGGLLVARAADRRLVRVAILPLEGSARGIALAEDGRCYVASGPAGVSVVDLADPAAPRLLRTVPPLAYARGVAVAGGRLYVAESDAGLRIFDVSDRSAAPAALGALKTLRSANRVSVEGGIAFVAEDSAGVTLVDVSDPGHAQRF